MSPRTKMRVVLFGECMLELRGQAFGAMHQGFGGDTLNTAVYLARCAPAGRLGVSYATALGDDALSGGMLARWAQEGLDTSLVRRIPGRLPGLYQIDVDARGERSFSYWRDHSAARAYFDAPQTPLESDFGDFGAFYFSGISLAILQPAGRERLFALLQRMRDRGITIIFDNNFRPRLWSDVVDARTAFERAFALASMVLVTADDHQALYGLATLDEAVRAAQALDVDEIVLKRGALPTLLRGDANAVWQEIATERVERVVDTTAAGDSFAAGYLSRRLLGADTVESARFANRLAARVIQHQGALIPREVMADLSADAENR
jgi:2-dehydro-3-deoxygluconokinase